MEELLAYTILRSEELISEDEYNKRLDELFLSHPESEEDIERILNTEGMIRSRRKIEAVIHNAECFRKIREEFGSFSGYIWGFTDGKTYLYTGHQKGQIPARNGLSDRVSRDLKKRGMKYMGSVTVYSHLQACGIINDHMESCFRYPQLLEITDAVRKRRDKE